MRHRLCIVNYSTFSLCAARRWQNAVRTRRGRGTPRLHRGPWKRENVGRSVLGSSTVTRIQYLGCSERHCGAYSGGGAVALNPSLLCGLALSGWTDTAWLVPPNSVPAIRVGIFRLDSYGLVVCLPNRSRPMRVGILGSAVPSWTSWPGPPKFVPATRAFGLH